MKSVALCLPILAACYGATPSKPVRNSLPPPIEAFEVVSTASYADEPSSPAEVRLPSWARTTAGAALLEEAFGVVSAAERRRMPSVIAAGVIATKRVATTAMWTPARQPALGVR